ncbi:MAG: hypothetical protein KJ050_13940, partial [Candidatus Omnitrophica bacterium]|nr:hypothetical protein [Candidatus Omnitrophota bacterium]
GNDDEGNDDEGNDDEGNDDEGTANDGEGRHPRLDRGSRLDSCSPGNMSSEPQFEVDTCLNHS